MGLALSLPLIPIQMVGSWVASCMGAACCTAFTNMFNVTFSSSIATRIFYAGIFLFNSILSWIMLSKWAVKKLEKLTFGLVKFEQGANFFGVQRVNFALAVFHLIMAALMVGVNSTKDPRAKIQNGLWSVKIFAWAFFLIVSFFIPDKFFEIYGNYFALIGAAIFNLIGLILLVDFAHEWSEICLEHIETESYLPIHLEYDEDDEGTSQVGTSNANFWTFVLVGGTCLMYVFTLIITVIMYIFFSDKGCTLNNIFITLNLLLAIIVTLLSISEKVREHNPSNGLGQAGMVCIYCTYLILSACCSAPDGKCNPVVRSSGTKTFNIVLSALFTFLAIAYTTTRAAANSAFTHKDDLEHTPLNDVISSQPGARDELRYQIIKQAVDEGSLPASTLEDPSWFANDNSLDTTDDERNATRYNYLIFHLIFLLATQFIATLLTMNVAQNDLGDFVPVGRTYFYSMVKMISAIICYLLYSWSLLAPILMPGRFETYL